MINLFTWLGLGPRRVVVDGDAMLKASGCRGKAAPRDQIRVLRQLGRFAQKEKIDMIVVLTGKPLRKAPDDASFEGIHVRYAETSTRAQKKIWNLFRRRRKKTTVVTDDSEMEQRIMEAGGAALRAGTFNKAVNIEGENASGGGSRKSGGGRRRGGRKRSSGSSPRSGKNESRESSGGGDNHGGNKGSGKKNDSDRGSEEDARIREMIDLV
ncbi:NYN domain-containing protein [Kiritimatiella glycovorans]|uniref:YacP-like NYN domain protein n=1 Tax=Kiritimatiella glycovorans TaxID=1307763 RepID=A0A0G3EG91_9BACT|nr:NYN domain-containing protein [Kiritimatiella glycovorans]AKJ63800.1 YacP-like NYN domain protein [Kiritimatiella glycovorans]